MHEEDNARDMGVICNYGYQYGPMRWCSYKSN